MQITTNLSQIIWASIEKLSPESLEELVNFIDYLNYKNQHETLTIKTSTISPTESDFIIEEILTEVNNSLPSLSDYAVSRGSIYNVI